MVTASPKVAVSGHSVTFSANEAQGAVEMKNSVMDASGTYKGEKKQALLLSLAEYAAKAFKATVRVAWTSKVPVRKDKDGHLKRTRTGGLLAWRGLTPDTVAWVRVVDKATGKAKFLGFYLKNAAVEAGRIAPKDVTYTGFEPVAQGEKYTLYKLV